MPAGNSEKRVRQPTVFHVRLGEDKTHSAAQLCANHPEISPSRPERARNMFCARIISDTLHDHEEEHEAEPDEASRGCQELHGRRCDATKRYVGMSQKDGGPHCVPQSRELLNRAGNGHCPAVHEMENAE
jgi:hypothetical protein